MYEVSEHVAKDAKAKAMSHEIKRLQGIIEKMGAKGQPCMALALYCNVCGGPHDIEVCMSPNATEEVDAIAYAQGQRGNSYENNGNGEGYGWKQGNGWNQGGYAQGRSQATQGGKPTYNSNREKIQITYGPHYRHGNNALYKPPHISQGELQPYRPNIREVDERLTKAIQELKNDRMLLKQEITQDFRQEMAAMRQDTQASMENLETQMSQLMKMMSKRPWGALPSNTQNKPKERVNAISVSLVKEGEISCEGKKEPIKENGHFLNPKCEER